MRRTSSRSRSMSILRVFIQMTAPATIARPFEHLVARFSSTCGPASWAADRLEPRCAIVRTCRYSRRRRRVPRSAAGRCTRRTDRVNVVRRGWGTQVDRQTVCVWCGGHAKELGARGCCRRDSDQPSRETHLAGAGLSYARSHRRRDHRRQRRQARNCAARGALLR